MPRKWSKAVPEGNCPVPHQDEFRPDQRTMADLYRMIKERFDQSSKNLDRMDSQFNQSDRCLDRMKSHIDEQDGKLDKLMDVTRETRQCLTGLEQEAWQSRPATESDVKPDTETRKRAEDAAADR
ncbi:unnamed protein product, partial [Ascophyllum nodosum]